MIPYLKLRLLKLRRLIVVRLVSQATVLCWHANTDSVVRQTDPLADRT